MTRARAIAAGLVALLGVLAGLAPAALLSGWLAALLLVTSIALGSLALLGIHRLTGGRWNAPIAGRLSSANRLSPLLIAAVLPVVIGAGSLFPWMTQADAADVRTWFLNQPFFAVRAVGGLAVMAVVSGLLGRASRLTAALALVTFGVMMSVIAVDWVLSLTPGVTSSGLGAALAIQALLAALAWGLAATPLRALPVADLGALMLALSLATFYFDAMTFIVNWYGDQPDRAAWYLARSTPEGLILTTLFVGLAEVGPALALMISSLRSSPAAVRCVAACVLVGLTAKMLWLVAPDASWIALGFTALVLAAGAVGLRQGPGAVLARREAANA